MSFGKTMVILPGDINRRVEKMVVTRLEGGLLTLVVAGHQGSRDSSCEEFSDALYLVPVVFSSGYDNLSRFPSAGRVQTR